MRHEDAASDHSHGERSAEIPPPIDDLFEFDEDPVDFMSAESFPASDPPPPQSVVTLPQETG